MKIFSYGTFVKSLDLLFDRSAHDCNDPMHTYV